MLRKTDNCLLLILIVMLLLSACQLQGNSIINDDQFETQVRDINEPDIQEKIANRVIFEALVKVAQEETNTQSVPEMVDENYAPLTQWTMLKMIERETSEVIESASQLPNITIRATYEDHISEQELVDIAVAVDYVKADVEDIIFYLDMYLEGYGTYADEAIIYLFETKTELMDMYALLVFFEDIVYQGEEVVNTDLNKLINSSIEMKILLDITQENIEQCFVEYELNTEQWKEEWMTITPDVEISEPIQIFNLLDDYVLIIYDCAGDNILDHDEIQKIVQAGVNAQFAIETYGGEDILLYSESITKMNRQAIYGDAKELVGGLKNFKIQLPTIKENYQ